MDILELELSRLHRDATLIHSIDDVDKIIDQLCKARESIATGKQCRSVARICMQSNISLEPNTASITMAKLQNPIKQGFEQVTEDLKKIYSGQSKYGRALDKVLPPIIRPTSSLTALELSPESLAY